MVDNPSSQMAKSTSRERVEARRRQTAWRRGRGGLHREPRLLAETLSQVWASVHCPMGNGRSLEPAAGLTHNDDFMLQKRGMARCKCRVVVLRVVVVELRGVASCELRLLVVRLSLSLGDPDPESFGLNPGDCREGYV